MVIEHTNAQAFEATISELETESAIATLLLAFGYDTNANESIAETPRRVRKAFTELLTAEVPKLTLFEVGTYTGMIVDANIPFYTLCEHHLLPFFGTVKVGYIPGEKIIGLSKLARVVEFFSKRLNTQEYFTQDIAQFLYEQLQAKGVGVQVSGRHLCKEMRGIKTDGNMLTFAAVGTFAQTEVWQQFLQAK